MTTSYILICVVCIGIKTKCSKYILATHVIKHYSQLFFVIIICMSISCICNHTPHCLCIVYYGIKCAFSLSSLSSLTLGLHNQFLFQLPILLKFEHNAHCHKCFGSDRSEGFQQYLSKRTKDTNHGRLAVIVLSRHKLKGQTI